MVWKHQMMQKLNDINNGLIEDSYDWIVAPEWAADDVLIGDEGERVV